MISADEAYDIAKKEFPDSEAETCLDFDKFYLFNFIPLCVTDKKNYKSGLIYPAVDKTTGKLFYYNLVSDYDAYEKAVPVKVSRFSDIKISDIK